MRRVDGFNTKNYFHVFSYPTSYPTKVGSSQNTEILVECSCHGVAVCLSVSVWVDILRAPLNVEFQHD